MSTKKPERPIGIDLFAGAGGLSLGFEQAGFDVVAAVELDPIHAAVHEFNFPKCTTLCRSVVDTTGEEIRALASVGDRDIDVVFGGAPCQGFSLIGKRAIDDPRNQLVSHFARIVSELNPKYFVFENVKGLTLGPHKQFLQELIELFDRFDYNVVKDYKVLNAAHFGVPQDRQRLFLLGSRKDQVAPMYPKRTRMVTVAEAINDLPDADGYAELLENDSVLARFGRPSAFAKRLRGLLVDKDDLSHPRVWDRRILTSSMRTEHSTKSRNRFKATAQGKVEPVSRYLKLDPNGVSNTLRAGTASDRGAFTSPRPIHPFLNRVITVREAARLHSYPDWFRFHVTKWHGFRQIGNSVPPLLGRAVAGEIGKALKVVVSKPTHALVLGDKELVRFDMSDAARHFKVSQDIIAKRQRVCEPPARYKIERLGSRAA